MKTYKDYLEEWELSVQSRELSFDEWLTLRLARLEDEWSERLVKCEARKNKQAKKAGYQQGYKDAIEKACEYLKDNFVGVSWIEDDLELFRLRMEGTR